MHARGSLVWNSKSILHGSVQQFQTSEPILGLGLPLGLCGLAPVIPQLQLAGLGLVGQPHQLVLPLLHP